MKVVVLISGKQGSGKSTLADNLSKILDIPVVRTRFAKVLYMMHDAVRDIGRANGIEIPEKWGLLLQWLGTEGVRDNFGQNSWVNCVKKEVSSYGSGIFIIDDCRFLNEVSAFDNDHEVNVLKVRLVADKDVRKTRANSWRDNDIHPSETELDGYKDFDVIISTDLTDKETTLDIVYKKIMSIVNQTK